MTNALKTNQIDLAVKHVGNIHDNYYKSSKPEWDRQLNRYISMCEGSLRNNYDINSFSNRIDRNETQEIKDAETTEIISEDFGQEFVCPILLENDSSVVILVNKVEPILNNLDKNILNEILNNPLNIFRFSKVLDDFKNAFDHPISLKAYKELMDISYSSDLISPMTRKNVIGCICLSSNSDHIDASSWTMARILTGNKLPGNKNLWYACLVLLVKYKQIPYLEPILPQLEAQMKYRMDNYNTNISLTGSPEYPTNLALLGPSIWYVFVSALFTDSKTDLLRTHLPYLDKLTDLVELCGYKIPEEICCHINRLRCMISMLGIVKREVINKTVGKLHNECLALVQNTTVIELNKCGEDLTETKVKYIPIDGEPTIDNIKSNLKKMSWNNLVDNKNISENDHLIKTANTIFMISTMVSPQKSAGDIILPVYLDIKNKIGSYNWGYIVIVKIFPYV